MHNGYTLPAIKPSDTAMPPSAETIPVILAIDTAGPCCSVALSIGDRVLARDESSARRHAQALLPMIDALLAEAEITLDAVAAIAVSVGPGSFTGLRIGVSAAQGLAMGCDIPVLAVSSLQALARAASHKHLKHSGSILALVDARMDELYAGCFRADPELPDAIDEAVVCAPEALRLPATVNWSDVLVAGNGSEMLPRVPDAANPALIDEEVMHSAIDVLCIGQQRFAAGETIAAVDLMPVYLRNQVTG